MGWKGRDKWDHTPPRTMEDVACLLRRRIEVHEIWRDFVLDGSKEAREAEQAGVGTAETHQVYIDQYKAALAVIEQSQNTDP